MENGKRSLEQYADLSKKKLRNDNVVTRATKGVRGTRILGRDYPLTNTTYKRLEIGVRIETSSNCFIEMAIGDAKNNEICFEMSTWKSLIAQKSDIMQRFHDNTGGTSEEEEPLRINHLTLQFKWLRDRRILKIADSLSQMYMTEETVRKLFSYEYCVNHMYTWLSENVHLVASKFVSFVNVLRMATTLGVDSATIISSSEEFEQHSLIDCELLALGLPLIVQEANKYPQ